MIKRYRNPLNKAITEKTRHEQFAKAIAKYEAENPHRMDDFYKFTGKKPTTEE